MRFFVELPLSGQKIITLPNAIYHHWCRVLRAKIGDSATLFDGQGGEYLATLTHIDKKSATAKLGAFNPINRTPPYQITLAQAISKGERMDYTIQKACEMGVSVIQPIISERSERLRYERDHKKLIHWQRIAISACEQCGLNVVPQLLPPLALSEYLSACQDPLKLVMAVNPLSDSFDSCRPLPARISILVGAEGGFADDEIAMACRQGFVAWTLGERVLRTETAGIVAMASLQMLYTLQNSRVS